MTPATSMRLTLMALRSLGQSMKTQYPSEISAPLLQSVYTPGFTTSSKFLQTLTVSLGSPLHLVTADSAILHALKQCGTAYKLHFHQT